MYEYSYLLEESMASLLISLISGIPSFVVSIATYVFTALALYTIAKRRGIDKAWLSWIPIGNVWILGSISDQFRYLTKGEDKSKRKILLWLNIASAVLAVIMVIIAIVMVVNAVSSAVASFDEEELLASMLGSLAGIMGLLVPIMGVSIAHAIIYYMALYDLYSSCDPSNNVVFLVVGLIVPITRPVFLFLCRNKDIGMPPRRVIPAPQDAYGCQNSYGNQQYTYQNPYGNQQQGGYQNPYGNQQHNTDYSYYDPNKRQ